MPVRWSICKFGKVTVRLPENCRNMGVGDLVTCYGIKCHDSGVYASLLKLHLRIVEIWL